MKPAWVEQVENLLVALEMYRIEEEKAINHLADILTAYGIDAVSYTHLDVYKRQPLYSPFERA